MVGIFSVETFRKQDNEDTYILLPHEEVGETSPD